MRINLTIDRFEGEKVILKTKDNETIVWPKNKLPENIHEGQVLAVSIGNEKPDNNNKQLAKDILNEILNPET